MQRIPLAVKPAQSFSITLGGQRCKITLTQRTTGMYIDLIVNGVPMLASAICLDRVRIVRYPYLGFIGDLAFADTQGKTDPVFSGFGSRYKLIYLEAADL